jgi:hypothetical protein
MNNRDSVFRVVCAECLNTETELVSVYKSPGRAWNDADITELSSFRRKSILAADLNTKHPFWNSVFNLNEFEISAPQCPTHYSPVGNGDVLDIAVQCNYIRVSGVIFSDILDSDHLSIVFYILDHVKIRNISEPIEKFPYWNRFQSLASELIIP